MKLDFINILGLLYMHFKIKTRFKPLMQTHLYVLSLRVPLMTTAQIHQDRFSAVLQTYYDIRLSFSRS